MRQLLSTSLAALLALPIALPAADRDEVLLLSFFRDNGQHGVYLAASDDGLTFRSLHGDRPVFRPPPWRGQDLTRDPSLVFQGGLVHMVWTTHWTGRTFGYATSPDLRRWSEPNRVTPFPAALPAADQPRNVWAPEIHWDPLRKDFLVVWSSTTDRESTNGDGSSDNGKDGANDHRLYASRTADGKTFSPARLFFDPKHSVIDGFLAFDDQGQADPAAGRWILVFKDERDVARGGKNLRLAFAPTDFSKPWSAPSAPLVGPGSAVRPREMAEGPTLLKRGGQWWLYWDAFANGHYGLAVSTDLQHWTDRTADLKLPAGVRHGTVFRAPRAAVAGLLKDAASPRP